MAEYVYQEYPKMIYHPDGTRKIIKNANELSDHLGLGWSTTPVAFSEEMAIRYQIELTKTELRNLEERLAAIEEADTPPEEAGASVLQISEEELKELDALAEAEAAMEPTPDPDPAPKPKTPSRRKKA